MSSIGSALPLLCEADTLTNARVAAHSPAGEPVDVAKHRSVRPTLRSLPCFQQNLR